MKLHIGGTKPKAGWKILNALKFEGIDFVGDVRDLRAFPDECCEKVYASHVMEHVGPRDFVSTLKGIHRILCKGGEFFFSVPDIEVLCRLFLSPELDASARFHVMRMMFGGQIDDYDFHYIGLSYEFMLNFFRQAGFSNVKQNAYIESFNGKFRDECLNEHWFVSMRHARQVIEEWSEEYNADRPHSSLGYLTPNQFADSFLTADSMLIAD